MKKILAIIMVICMIAVFVPAFAVSAAEAAPSMEELLVGKQPLRAYSSYPSGDNLTVADYASINVGAQVNGFGCGFIDGNVFFDQIDAKTLLRGLSDTDLNKTVLTFVDGQPALQAPAHAGYLEGRGLGGGWQLGIFGAEFVKGKEQTVTIIFGNTGYYTQFTVTSDVNTLSYTSSNAVIKGAKATVTVTGGQVADNYSVGDTVKAQLHDDHSDREFTVASVDAATKTVVFECKDFASTSKTLLEFNKGSDKGFCVLVDTNQPGGTIDGPSAGESVACAVQTRNSGRDFRFIFSAHVSDLASGLFDSSITLTFYKGAAEVKSFTRALSDLNCYYNIIANGEYLSAKDGDALFGFALNGVPTFAWSSYTVTVTNGTENVYEASVEKSLDETIAMGGYIWIGEDNANDREQNIHAGSPENPTSGDRVGNNEGAWRMFDKTDAKVGVGGGEGNKGKVQFTWNYNTAKTISLYALYTGNDSRGSTNRNPLSWIFYGSNDGENFNEIDNVESAKFPGEGGQGVYFTVDAPVSYQYYKIVFTTNADAYFQLAEMKCFETATEVKYNFSDTISGIAGYSSNPGASYGHEALPQLFDGNINTKFGYYAKADKVTINWYYDAPAVATGYSITTANDSTYWKRNPSGWTLYGSVDGNDYVVLDTVTSSTLFSLEKAIFAIDEDVQGSYQYYRIVFDVSKSDAFQMADISLFN